MNYISKVTCPTLYQGQSIAESQIKTILTNLMTTNFTLSLALCYILPICLQPQKKIRDFCTFVSTQSLSYSKSNNQQVCQNEKLQVNITRLTTVENDVNGGLLQSANPGLLSSVCQQLSYWQEVTKKRWGHIRYMICNLIFQKDNVIFFNQAAAVEQR